MIAALVLAVALVVTLAASTAWFAALAHARRTEASAAARAHEHDQARSSELLHLLEARMAPAEFAAWVAPPPPAQPQVLMTDDGLAWVELDEAP